jgi:hypothetical protein
MKPLALVAAIATPSFAAPCPETAKTAAAVKCVEDHWQAAFLSGDEPYLSQLLSDGYRSYSPSGEGHDRAAIVGFAKEYAKKHHGEKVSPSMLTPDIEIRGDIAVVFWRDHGTLSSVDSFYWADGRWRGWYSQHAGASK